MKIDLKNRPRAAAPQTGSILEDIRLPSIDKLALRSEGAGGLIESIVERAIREKSEKERKENQIIRDLGDGRDKGKENREKRTVNPDQFDLQDMKVRDELVAKDLENKQKGLPTSGGTFVGLNLPVAPKAPNEGLSEQGVFQAKPEGKLDKKDKDKEKEKNRLL